MHQETKQPDKERRETGIAALRTRLAGKTGRAYWRSLEEVADTAEFQEWVADEFPNRSSLLSVDRRSFLKVMGASLALAGLSGCRYQPQEKLVPYVRQPEEIVPGKPLFYTSALSIGGFATGVLVESHMGRPTKIEGNPDHPASLGKIGPLIQAQMLDLYDPTRSQNVVNTGAVSTYTAFVAAVRERLVQEQASGGAGIRILTETVTSPTLAAQMEEMLARYPNARWHQWEAIGRDNAREGAVLAFGQDVNTVYRLRNARIILSLDADFLTEGPAWLRYAAEFAEGRRMRAGRTEMNRLYVIESQMTATGASADHRIPARALDIARVAAALASRLGVGSGLASDVPGVEGAWLDALAQDLLANRGKCAVIAGPYQPAAVHALAHLMNAVLGATGQTVLYTAPVEARPESQMDALIALTREMNAGRVHDLFILGGNPLYSAPADLEFAQALDKVPFSAHLSSHLDETSAHCHWHVNAAHPLEMWSDARAFDGTASLVQPLILPLYQGKSAHEILSVLMGGEQDGYDLVRGHWQRQVTLAGTAFERFWQETLSRGVVPASAFPTVVLPVAATAAARAAAGISNSPAGEDIEIAFRPDPNLWDGRFASNGWLQELPKPMTKLTWSNAAFVSPNTAERLNLRTDDFEGYNGDTVELTRGTRKINATIWVQPGHPDNSVTVYLGHGRERIAAEIWLGAREQDYDGFSAEPLRTTEAFWQGSGLQLRPIGESEQLASTQHHFSMEGREIVRETILTTFVRTGGEVASEAEHLGNQPATSETENREGGAVEVGDATVVQRGFSEGEARAVERHEEGKRRRELTLYNPEAYVYDGYKWGMVIDLTTCVGCNACELACQAENNIPVVGKEQVRKGRVMHWIRVDRYFSGKDLSNPEAVFMPVPCMQCENAPCEPVCPVAATVHSHEGLNQMVYNRCIGTRYCSNNCPYKVRRFNFLNFANNHETPVLKMLMNPDVTVRGRGVMEKCTYCVQRINQARIEAKKENRKIRDGEIVTACQQACPTDAIIFGDLGDVNSRVSQLAGQPHNYSLLDELNTKPRTTYLTRVRNPNPALPRASGTEMGMSAPKEGNS